MVYCNMSELIAIDFKACTVNNKLQDITKDITRYYYCMGYLYTVVIYQHSLSSIIFKDPQPKFS